MMALAADGAPEAILVFRIGSIGDTVVALPALRAIRRRHASAHLILLTNSPVDGGLKAASAVQILDGTGLIDEFIEYPHGVRSLRRLLSLALVIRRTGARLCYFLMPARSPAQVARDRLFFRLAGITRIEGSDPNIFRTLPPGPGEVLWEGEARRLLRAAGADPHRLSVLDFSLALSATECTAALDVLQAAGIRSPFIAISVGAKVPVNDWGDAHWMDCIRQLASRAPDHALVAVGAGVEAARSAGVLATWPGATGNLCGQLAPRLSAAVLARARLFIGHDSGPMHLAAAVATPTLAVFSARNQPGVWFPIGQEKNVFYNSVACRGCNLDVCVDQGQRCIAEIQPLAVAERAGTILAIAASGISTEIGPLVPARARQ